MNKNVFVFPAIITKLDDNDYNVRFPNFEHIITYGENIEEACFMAEDALKLELFDSYTDNKEIPEATKLKDIQVNKDQFIVLVKVDLKKTIREYDNKAVKKTLTIPAWLNKEAENAHVNYSQILQEALKQHLHLDN